VTAAATHGPAAAWRVVRSRTFGPYFVGNAASASGTWFQNLAGSILIFRLTHSAFLLGVLNFCQFVPVLLLAPWAGGIADRFDRRRLLLVTQTLAAVLSATLAGVAWSGHASEWVVIAFSGCLGVTTAISNPAQTAMVGSLVPREDLAQAIALNSMTFNLARAIGPASAAGVIAAFGTSPAFAVNALSYLVLVGALLVIRPKPHERAKRATLRESIALVRADPRLGAYLLIVMTVSFASDPVNTEGPALAHAFGYSDAWSGAIVGFFGAGAVCAALLVAGRVSGSRRRMATTLALLGVGIGLVGVTHWLPIGFLFLAIAGFGYLSSNTSATSRLQLAVADNQRGRIMALWSIAFLGIRPIASICDGTLAGAFGVRTAAAVMALPALAAAAALTRPRRKLLAGAAAERAGEV
jgi:MFS family permease